MTDIASPITGPHQLTPMFATGAQPTPNTEPNHAPIFDTGPHPDPLQAVTAETQAAETQSAEVHPVDGQSDGDWASAEWDSDEWAAAEWRNPDPEPAADEAPRLESVPGGVDPDLNLVLDAIDGEPRAPVPQAFSELENVDTDTFLASVTGHMQPVVVPAHPVVVPGAYQFVKRWKFALILAGVWLVSAAAGLGFYYWWYTALSKTIPVFGVLAYLTVCMVASLLVSLVPNRPHVTASAIALMGAPLASMAAAAVLHGAYYFEWIARPIVG